MKGLFDSTFSVLGNALDLRAARNKLLSSNLANQETPGYQARDINFEAELKKSVGQETRGTLLRTSPAHIPIISEAGVKPAVVERPTGIEGYDNNSVGVEAEMVKLSENSLMYNITAKMLRDKFSTLMTAIKEGGR